MSVAEERTSPEFERVVRALGALATASTTYHLYPNPKEQPAFLRALGVLEATVSSQGQVSAKVGRSRFRVGDSEIDSGGDALDRLAGALFERGVTEIHVRSAPTLEELATFCSLVSEEPAALEASEGPRAYLLERNVLAIRLVGRDLVIGTPELASLAFPALPGELRDLLADRQLLAEAIERDSTPAEALRRFQELVSRGVELGIDPAELYGGVADTVAAMSFRFRVAVVGLALQQREDLGAEIAGQLSDGELADILVALASDRGLDLAMTYALQAARDSGGHREELPVIVGKRLIEEGFERETVLHVFGTTRLLPDAALRLATDALSHQMIIEEQPDVAELRREAPRLSPELEFATGLWVLRALFRADESEEDFEGLVDQAEHWIRRWVMEGTPGRALDLIAVVVEEAERHPDPARRARLERTAGAVASSETVAALLSASAENDDPARRMASLLGRRIVPALTEALQNEPDRVRRKMLVEMLAEVAVQDVSPLVTYLDGSPWYLARNIATILSRLEPAQATPHLVRLAAHEDWRVRREALRGLAATAGASAVPALGRGLEDPDRTVRLAAIAALGAIQHPAATDRLIALARRRSVPIRERKEALASLRLHQDDEARRFLEKTANRRWPPTPATRELARHARELLSKMPAATGGETE